MPQRILFTVEHLYPFGDARLLLPLCRHLIGRGWDVVVVVIGQSTFPAERWFNTGVRLFFANGDDQTPLHTNRDAFYVAKELRSLIRIVEPDVIHAWCGEAIWLTLLATQPIRFLNPLPNSRLTATELSMRREKSFPRTWLEDRMANRIEKLFVPHPMVIDSFEELGITFKETQTIPNAGTWGDFEPDRSIALSDRGAITRDELRLDVRERLELPADARLAVTIADLVPSTRLKDLIWATDLLACIRDDFHFVVIGVGSQEKRLKRFAALTEARAHVHLIGQSDRPESILAASDFYWHSHLQSPTSSNLLSAMAMGIPTVSVLGPGTEAIVKHQETGFAVNFGARDEFARWTKFLIERPEEGAKLARQGQQYALASFAMDEFAASYEDGLQG